MTRPVFFDGDRQRLRKLRFEHPRVQVRMEMLRLVSCGESYSSASRLTNISDATIDRYVAIYRERSIEGLNRFDWQRPTSELPVHQGTLEEEFRARPPHTVAEASRRVEEATGVRRGLTQVWHFLKKSLGLQWNCATAISLSPKKTVEEHSANHAKFLVKTLEPKLESARRREGQVFFVQAVHLFQGALLC